MLSKHQKFYLIVFGFLLMKICKACLIVNIRGTDLSENGVERAEGSCSLRNGLLIQYCTITYCTITSHFGKGRKIRLQRHDRF